MAENIQVLVENGLQEDNGASAEVEAPVEVEAAVRASAERGSVRVLGRC